MTAEKDNPAAGSGGHEPIDELPTIKKDSTYKKVSGGVTFGKADIQKRQNPVLDRDEPKREHGNTPLNEQARIRAPKSTTNHLGGHIDIDGISIQNLPKSEKNKTILHRDEAIRKHESIELDEPTEQRASESTTNRVQIKEGEKSDSESGLYGDTKDLHEDRAITEHEGVALSEQVKEISPKSTTNPVQIQQIDRDRRPCNLLLTSLLDYYSTTTTQIYQEEVVDLEAFVKRFSEIVSILKENKEEKACILLFAEKYHAVYQGIIHKLYPQANIWVRLQDLKEKGFLDSRERSEIDKRILLPIEAAITRVSRAGERQIEQIKYYTLTEEGKLFVRTFKKPLFNVLPEAKREQVKDLNALLYHSHKQHEFVEQNRIKAEKEQQRREEKAKIAANLEELISAHEEEIAALTRVDFGPRPSEELQELLTTLRHETGHSHKISEIKEAWKLVCRRRIGLA